MLVLGLTGLPAAPRSWAATYQCVDPSGKTIFTDSPSQLQSCTVLDNAAIRAPAPPAPPAARPSDPDVSPPGAPPSSPDGTPGAPAAAPVSVPVLRAGRSLVVQARLNGTLEARLIVDTGAEITVLSHQVALDLGIVPTASDRTVTLNTVGGSVRADLVRVASIAVGGAEVQNVVVVVHDLPDAAAGVDGLLGLTFLDRFLVTLDAQKGELHLRPRE